MFTFPCNQSLVRVTTRPCSHPRRIQHFHRGRNDIKMKKKNGVAQ